MTEKFPAIARETFRTVVWDIPVRIVHWCLVLLLPALWWTAENNYLSWHIRIGEVLLGLLLFRVLWGLFGSSTARFTTFVRGPRAILEFLRSGRNEISGHPSIGHTPLGALSVVAMLSLLLSQVATGLIAGDPDDGATGPLNHLVGYATAMTATDWHEIGFNIILGLVILHVVAIGFYFVRKGNNLVKPMITGHKSFSVPVSAPQIASATRAIICAGAALAITVWLASGAPTKILQQDQLEGK